MFLIVETERTDRERERERLIHFLWRLFFFFFFLCMKKNIKKKEEREEDVFLMSFTMAQKTRNENWDEFERNTFFFFCTLSTVLLIILISSVTSSSILKPFSHFDVYFQWWQLYRRMTTHSATVNAANAQLNSGPDAVANRRISDNFSSSRSYAPECQWENKCFHNKKIRFLLFFVSKIIRRRCTRINVVSVNNFVKKLVEIEWKFHSSVKILSVISPIISRVIFWSWVFNRLKIILIVKNSHAHYSKCSSSFVPPFSIINEFESN